MQIIVDIITLIRRHHAISRTVFPLVFVLDLIDFIMERLFVSTFSFPDLFLFDLEGKIEKDSKAK